MPERRSATDQLGLPFGLDEPTLKSLLEEATGRKVSLSITDNSSSILSVKSSGGTLAVRAHRMFLCADSAVLDEMARFALRKIRKTPHINSFIKRNRDSLRKKTPRKQTPRTAGANYELQGIFDRINREYFENRVTAAITWGTRNGRRWVRRMTLGSFSCDTNTIRINPVLDSRRYPAFFVEYIVYHEMLHADLGIKEENGRRSIHSGEFRKREKLFKDYMRAIAWEKGG